MCLSPSIYCNTDDTDNSDTTTRNSSMLLCVGLNLILLILPLLYQPSHGGSLMRLVASSLHQLHLSFLVSIFVLSADDWNPPMTLMRKMKHREMTTSDWIMFAWLNIMFIMMIIASVCDASESLFLSIPHFGTCVNLPSESGVFSLLLP